MNDGNTVLVGRDDAAQPNPFALAQRGPESLTAMGQSRAAQEVQAAMVVAKKFPRDMNMVHNRIMESCKRKKLAEVAVYAYPRGGQTVEGPSIRLAEAIAQNYGNLDFGIKEIEQRNGESVVEAYCWDMETNTRQTKIFTVPHSRSAGGAVKKLTDPRDIYEAVANQGARRLRACILGIIPGDIVESALEEVENTLKKAGDGVPLIDRVRKMASAFSELGITIAMLEKRLAHKLDSTIESELISLRKIYTSIKDGAAPREQFFDIQAREVVKPVDLHDGPGTGTDNVPMDAAPVTKQPAAATAAQEKAPAAAATTDAPAASPTLGEKPKAKNPDRIMAYESLLAAINASDLTEAIVTEYFVSVQILPPGYSLSRCASPHLQGLLADWPTIEPAVKEYAATLAK